MLSTYTLWALTPASNAVAWTRFVTYGTGVVAGDLNGDGATDVAAMSGPSLDVYFGDEAGIAETPAWKSLRAPPAPTRTRV